jgi:hypothetical protein
MVRMPTLPQMTARPRTVVKVRKSITGGPGATQRCATPLKIVLVLRSRSRSLLPESPWNFPEREKENENENENEERFQGGILAVFPLAKTRALGLTGGLP